MSNFNDVSLFKSYFEYSLAKTSSGKSYTSDKGLNHFFLVASVV